MPISDDEISGMDMMDEDMYIALLTLALLSGVVFYMENHALVLSTLNGVLSGAG